MNAYYRTRITERLMTLNKALEPKGISYSVDITETLTIFSRAALVCILTMHHSGKEYPIHSGNDLTTIAVLDAIVAHLNAKKEIQEALAKG